MSRSKLLGALIALPMMVAGASSAQANIIGLTIDGSGSISAADFSLQKSGYVSALTALLNTDGTNSIGVWQFSASVSPVFAVTKIDSAAAKASLIAAISGMTQLGGLTAIGDSIVAATAGINAHVGGFGSKIIDVSTDGFNNTGVAPATATAAANLSGITVNCLGIGGAADCSWNGTGTDFAAATFADFEAAIRTKLSKELTGVPEPMTLTLFGAGLAGAAAMRRRMKKA
ncbi:MAG TPA: DUF1194 domain-containing protein [Rhizomicrobium sp.]|nr:DUF1194 domain-containing protein [Rhizomicrobium sp.]